VLRDVAAFALLLLAAFVASPACATAEYDYKKGERRIIDGGLAPNKKYAISAGLSGEGGPYFFLTSEPAHRTLVRLEGIGPDQMLDTAPEALHAIWAPDSRHVAIIFRTERHVLTMWLYGVDGRNVEHIAVGDLLDQVIKDKKLAIDDYSLRLRTIEITWQGSQRFQLIEKWIFDARDRKLALAIGSFGKESPNDNYKETGDDGKPLWTFVDIAVDADCEIAPGNRYRVIAAKPGTFVLRE
jgi:hypothetical protein